MSAHRFREFLQSADSTRFGPLAPTIQEAARFEIGLLIPELTQVFFQIIRRRQRLIEFERFFEPFRFLLLVVEILRVLQEQPASAFENLLLMTLASKK